jgi:N-acetylneuraminic acid mutarotase
LNIYFLEGITVLILVGIISMTTSSFSSGDSYSYWSIGEKMPTERLESSAVAVENKIYIIGGMNEIGSTDIVEVYNTDTNKWNKVSPLPERLDHTAAATFEGKIYVAGGFNSSGVSTKFLFIYDPNNDRWERAANMPTARGALTAKFVNGMLYAIGGDETVLYDLNKVYNPQGVVTSNEAYNPETDSWTTKSPMPTPRDHLSSVVIGKSIYELGGRQPDIGPLFKDLNSNERYDPVNNTWHTLKPFPTNRSGLAAASHDGKAYVFGGESTKMTFDTNEVYDPETESWTSLPLMPSPRHGLTAVTIDDKIYVIAGGPEPGGAGSDINEIFHIR